MFSLLLHALVGVFGFLAIDWVQDRLFPGMKFYILVDGVWVDEFPEIS